MKQLKICNLQFYLEEETTLEERENLEHLMTDGNLYYDFISPNAQKIIQNYNNVLAQTPTNEKNSFLKQAIAKIEEKKVQHFHKIQREEQKVRTLKKGFERRAGFINASILLYAILNLGIMVAVMLIIL